jgi:hypothetical protein
MQRLLSNKIFRISGLKNIKGTRMAVTVARTK